MAQTGKLKRFEHPADAPARIRIRRGRVELDHTPHGPFARPGHPIKHRVRPRLNSRHDLLFCLFQTGKKGLTVGLRMIRIEFLCQQAERVSFISNLGKHDLQITGIP